MSSLIERFDDVFQYPYYYFNKLITFNRKNASDEEIDKMDCLKFLYGPYLVMTNDASKFDRNGLLKMDQDITMMINMSNILKCINSHPRVYQLKNVIRNAICNIDQNSPYKEIFSKKCLHILDNLRDIQYNEKLLESSLVNYSPIVPYSQVIRKPGDESVSYKTCVQYKSVNITPIIDYFHKYKTREDLINNVIRPLLITNIVDILKYNSYNNNPFFVSKPQNVVQIEPTILTYNPNECTEETYRYFVIVYLTYAFIPNEYNNIADRLSELIEIFTDLKEGKVVNVERAVECMSSLTTIV